MENNNSERKKAVSEVIILLVILAFIFGMVMYFVVPNFKDFFNELVSPYKINVDLCLAKDNFVIDGKYIVETLENTAVVKEKTFNEDKRYYTYVIEVEEKGQIVPVYITSDNWECNDTIDVGDTITDVRKVYYTKNGYRLYYKDYVTKVLDETDDKLIAENTEENTELNN